MMRYERLVRWVAGTAWAIEPEMGRRLVGLLADRVAGQGPTEDGLTAALAIRTERAAAVAAARDQAGQGGGVAVLPLFGVLAQRADEFDELSGAMSVERFGRRFREAVSDSQVGSIVIQVDSPGGNVYGIDELSSEIYQARGSKPIVAVADSLAASAAYWVATAAEELVVTPGGEVGSIGVYSLHQDISRALEAIGVTMTFVAAGKYKIEGNAYEPLGEEARSAIQSRVDDYYAAFTGAVARNRGVPVGQVRDGFGEGRVVGARQAVALGMADRVATMRETIDDLQSGRYARRRKRMGAETDGTIRADDGAGTRVEPPAGGLEVARRRLGLAGLGAFRAE